MDQFSLLIPLLLALSSLLHCLGMCGGIVGAISLHLSSGMGITGRQIWPFLLAANLGRLVSYSVAGGLVASFGRTLFVTISPDYGHLLLQGFAGLILVGNGLFLLGRFPEMRHMERWGYHLWHALEPLARRFMTPRTVGQAFAFGVVWGWFPCSLVYGALLWSGASCSAWSGAAVMLLFGLGTLPVMLSAGWLTNALVRKGGLLGLGRIIAIILLGIGIFNLILLGWDVHNPHLHEVNHLVNCLIPP
ncbi:MAG: sulfite exporter TauE/SafE family protein [Magnetococcales bacterium]|nr:sulfite exporter TauE/SafE family protein [Magnetococcales bacterium]NGZ06914.1 sulfite exporter TauE/SafE family protein [Magnetococcales bacterium]